MLHVYITYFKGDMNILTRVKLHSMHIHVHPFIIMFHATAIFIFVHLEFKRNGFGENKSFEAVIVEDKNS